MGKEGHAKYIDPFSDNGFKALFGREGMSEEVLRELLNEIFRGQPHFENITSVQFVNTVRNRENDDDKTIIHDVLCVTDSGYRFIVEMQAGYQRQFLLRAVYYVSRGVTDQARRGPGEPEWRYEFDPVVGTFITKFHVPGLPKKVLTHASITDLETGDVIAPHMRFAFIQTNYFNKEESECETKFEKLLFVLKNMATLYAIPFKETENDVFSRMDHLAQYANLTEEERRLYDYELKKRRDLACEIESAYNQGEAKGLEGGLVKGRAEGREEGLEEGMLKKAQAIARNMKSSGMYISQIADFTGLTAEEIAAL